VLGLRALEDEGERVIKRQDGRGVQAQLPIHLLRPVVRRQPRHARVATVRCPPVPPRARRCTFVLVSWVAPLGPPAHLLLLLALYLLAFSAPGLYRPRLNLSVLDDLPHLLKALVLAGGLQAAVLAALSAVDPLDRQLRHAVALLEAVFVLRGLAYAGVRALRRSGGRGIGPWSSEPETWASG